MQTVKRRIATLRAIDRLINSAEFKEYHAKNVKKVDELIEKQDLIGLKGLLKSCDLTTRKLKAKASQLKIPNYSRMSRAELLEKVNGRNKN
jgi:hypothetical protein